MLISKAIRQYLETRLNLISISKEQSGYSILGTNI